MTHLMATRRMAMGTSAVNTAKATTGSRPAMRPYKNDDLSGVHNLRPVIERGNVQHGVKDQRSCAVITPIHTLLPHAIG